MKPILFNTEMCRAILDGRKTETRRVVKPQPCKGEENPHQLPSGCWFFDVPSLRFPGTNDKIVGPYWSPCQPGDILYVRETWFKDAGRYMFKANYSDGEKFYRSGKEVQIRWRPSIHMPKEAARLFLRVKDVQVERLQDITEEEKLKEGAPHGWGQYNFYELWDSTIKKGDLPTYGWSANPWVFVIEFERISREDVVDINVGNKGGQNG